MNAPNNNGFILFFNLTGGFGMQASLTGGYVARFQRAAKCTGQSTRRGGNDIIQCGRVGFMNLGVHAVMFRNFRMNAE
jgi:hypothetical protein